MAYTPPNDLFTSEEAILSLASSIADEDRTNLGNGTINGALDVLAAALAERNVEVPPMNAGAILALADYVSGGGGGGSATTDMYLWNLSEDESFINAAFKKVLVQTGLNDLQSPVFEEVAFTPITETFQGMTAQGAKVEGVPCGALVNAQFGGASSATFKIGYGQNGGVMDAAMQARLFTGDSQGIALMPVDGFKCVCAVFPKGNI